MGMGTLVLTDMAEPGIIPLTLLLSNLCIQRPRMEDTEHTGIMVAISALLILPVPTLLGMEGMAVTMAIPAMEDPIST